jgi:cyclophilin family peptidyl-prolyl cis-trans isomerase/TolA-binding protein
MPKRYLRILAAIVISLNVAGLATAQEPAPPDAAPATDAVEPKKPLPPAAAKALKDFEKGIAEWKDMMKRMRELQRQYQIVKPEDRAKIDEESKAIVKKGDELEPSLLASAEEVYKVAPTDYPDVTNYVISMAFVALKKDRYEQAARLASLVSDHNYPDGRVNDWAGIAYFALGDYDNAEKYFKRSEEAGTLTESGKTVRAEIEPYRELWKSEEAARKAEAQADDLPRVLLKTTKGDITLELFENEAPNTVANFINLVEKGFYNGLTFHRVIPGFMAQGGDPKGDGTGGPGYNIACECYAENHRNHFLGSLSMAHAGRDTGGSQFFINLRPTPHLNGQHTVFGRVIDGFDVVANLQETTNRGRPIEPDKILEATVLRKRNHEYKPVTHPEK